MILGSQNMGFTGAKTGAFSRRMLALQDQYAGTDTETRLTVLRQVAAEIGATPNQIVLAWIIRQDAPIIPLFFTSTIEQIKENLGAIHLQLSAEQMIRLNEAGA